MLALAQQRRDAEKNVGALGGGCSAPGFESRVRSLYRAIGELLRGLMKTANDFAAICRIDLLSASPVEYSFAGDYQRVLTAQLAFTLAMARIAAAFSSL